MSINIIKSSEAIKITRVVGLLYGFPGAGKTSTANTTKNPVTLDFDNGAHRSGYRKDVLRITKWEDIQSDYKAFYKAIDQYDTIVIDTISTCLDYIGEFLVRNNRKLITNKLKFYGELKDVFGSFVQTLKANGKDLVFVAQVKEREENGVSVKRPDITGSSYDIVTSLCDFIGYQYYRDKVRVLDFDPTEEYIGKNPMGFEKTELPNYAMEPSFFADRITEIKDRLGNISQAQKEASDKVLKIINGIKEVKNVDELNEVVNSIKEAKYEKPILAQIRPVIAETMKNLGAVLNKDTDKYEIPTQEGSEPEHELAEATEGTGTEKEEKFF